MRGLTALVSCATRVRTRLFSAACGMHWTTYGDKTEVTFILDEERRECSIDCEAVGGDYHCVCVVQEDVPPVIEYVDPDVETNYPEIDEENGMRYCLVQYVHGVQREYAEIYF